MKQIRRAASEQAGAPHHSATHRQTDRQTLTRTDRDTSSLLR